MFGIAVFLWRLKKVRPLWRRSGTGFKWLLLPYVADCRGCRNIVPCCRCADGQGIRNGNGGGTTKRLLLSVKIVICMLTTRICYKKKTRKWPQRNANNGVAGTKALPTACRTALLEKPVVAQLVTFLNAFCGTWSFMTVFTKALRWLLPSSSPHVVLVSSRCA